MNARRLSPRLLAFGLLAVAALWMAAGTVAAHSPHVVGPYTLTIGWQSEPAVVGVANAITVEIVENDTTAVANADADLTATLLSGGASAVRTLEPSDETPGLYTIALIPTREGAYSVRVAGTLNGTAVNLTASVEAPEGADEYAFPAVDPSAHELQAELDDANAALAAEHANTTALAARVSALESGGANTSGTLIAFAGLAAGAAGVVVGLIAMRKGKAPK